MGSLTSRLQALTPRNKFQSSSMIFLYKNKPLISTSSKFERFALQHCCTLNYATWFLRLWFVVSTSCPLQKFWHFVLKLCAWQLDVTYKLRVRNIKSFLEDNMTARPEWIAIWLHISDVNYPSIRCCITSNATRGFKRFDVQSESRTLINEIYGWS